MNNYSKLFPTILSDTLNNVDQSKVVPTFMKDHVKNLLKDVSNNHLGRGENPIAKIPLHITGDLNGNSILIVLGPNDNLSINLNETEGHRVECLHTLYDKENIK